VPRVDGPTVPLEHPHPSKKNNNISGLLSALSAQNEAPAPVHCDQQAIGHCPDHDLRADGDQEQRDGSANNFLGKTIEILEIVF